MPKDEIIQCQECGDPAEVQKRDWLPLCKDCNELLGELGYDAQKAAWDKFKRRFGPRGEVYYA
ncbi:hypothetical protein LCGC14_2677510 [marine sediment metagenome]|uniref:Uncharacterized protein n=1 Tax=marine sediment metagenome TaxID=412755 RepID=A0A0F9BX75_9ZZZZ